MKNIITEGSNREPAINFNANTGQLQIAGRSIPEGIGYDFYQPLLEWVQDYVKKPAKRTDITFKLEYCNTASFEIIFREMLRRLDLLASSGNNVTMHWHYEKGDDDMKDAGQDLASLLKHIKVQITSY